MIGCSRCGHVWDSCECPDLETLGSNLDMFEKEVGDFSNPRRVNGKNDDVDLGSHYRNEFKGINS